MQRISVMADLVRAEKAGGGEGASLSGVQVGEGGGALLGPPAAAAAQRPAVAPIAL